MGLGYSVSIGCVGYTLPDQALHMCKCTDTLLTYGGDYGERGFAMMPECG